jgi:hypothetical protein
MRVVATRRVSNVRGNRSRPHASQASLEKETPVTFARVSRLNRRQFRS